MAIKGLTVVIRLVNIGLGGLTQGQKRSNLENFFLFPDLFRTQFEEYVSKGHFVEHGEYEKSYYGTSLDSIRY